MARFGEAECGHCGLTFERSRPHEDLVKEAEELFGSLSGEDLIEVCDVCWENLHPSRNPVEYQQYLDEKSKGKA